MSTGDEIHVGDIGTVFRALITDCGTPVDLASASSLLACFDPPGNDPFTRAMTFVSTINSGAGDGSDGFIEYTSVTSDLFIEGEWEWQAQVIIAAGRFHTNVASFEVFPNLNCFPQSA